jgi:hypothetical protein
MASCIRSNLFWFKVTSFLLSRDWFLPIYDCSGERSNRAQEIVHRAAIVGGFTRRYRSSFFGDGEPVRICPLLYMLRVSSHFFGETGTLVPGPVSSARIIRYHGIVLRSWGVPSDELVQFPTSLCSACASDSSVVEIAL